MVLENLPGTDTLVLVALLAIFIIVGYKVLEILTNAIIVAILAAIFPHALNIFFGTHFATSLNAELTYVVAGVGMYFLYEILAVAFKAGGIFWELAEIAATPIVWIYEGIKGLIESVSGGNKAGEIRKEKKEKASKKTETMDENSGKKKRGQKVQKRNEKESDDVNS